MSVFDQQCLEAIDLLLLEDDWEAAHKIVQDINSPVAQLIHAVLHKIEGDEANSRYWYNQSALDVYETYNNYKLELQSIKINLLG
tara:strand:+ start:11637 stop:11891 length:255 start_codon:yes stop_codon:yes gene_type:complete